MILDTIARDVRRRLEQDRRERPMSLLERELAASEIPLYRFSAALRRPGLQIIAEIKRASPSAGDIRVNADVTAIAREYRSAGAAAISVLTERDHFKGHLHDLRQVAAQVPLPVLRKDFILDPYQILEARLSGASTYLLIISLLEPSILKDLLDYGRELGMTALVEVHDGHELEQALAQNARVIGINNRNLKTFEVDLDTSIDLRPEVPSDRLCVSESGIRNRTDLQRIADAGFDAVLIGEALMRDPESLLSKAGDSKSWNPSIRLAQAQFEPATQGDKPVERRSGDHSPSTSQTGEDA